VEKILKGLVNVLSVIYSHIYFPTYFNSLKEVGAYLGSAWTEPDSSGVQSLVWRRKWEATRSEYWKRLLIAYNMEDCMALKRVTAFIYDSCTAPRPALEQRSSTETGPIVASVDEIDRLGAVNNRGRKEFFHADFAYINKCARFDYQRQRVYVRLGKRRRKKGNKHRKDLFRNQKLRVTQRIKIVSRKCPSCGSTDIDRPTKAHFGKGCFTKGKRAFELVFTSNGVKRKVIECVASVHHCLKCGQTFVPSRYERLAKHFHGLMSWAMNEYIAYRVSCPMVSVMIDDCAPGNVCSR
jgi:hypothetical protein